MFVFRSGSSFRESKEKWRIPTQEKIENALKDFDTITRTLTYEKHTIHRKVLARVMVTATFFTTGVFVTGGVATLAPPLASYLDTIIALENKEQRLDEIKRLKGRVASAIVDRLTEPRSYSYSTSMTWEEKRRH